MDIIEDYDREFWHVELDGAVATLSCPEVVYVDAEGAQPERDARRFWLELALSVDELRQFQPGVGAVIWQLPKAQQWPSFPDSSTLAIFAELTCRTIADASDISRQVYVGVLDVECVLDASALATQFLIAVEDAIVRESALSGFALHRLQQRRGLDSEARAGLTTETVQAAFGAGAVDEIATPAAIDNIAMARARGFAACTDRPEDAEALTLVATSTDPVPDRETLRWCVEQDGHHLKLEILGPDSSPAGLEVLRENGFEGFWTLLFARELSVLFRELMLGDAPPQSCEIRSRGENEWVAQHDLLLCEHADDWQVREITLALRHALWLFDCAPWTHSVRVTAASCFCGSLAELVFGADQVVMDAAETPEAVDPETTLLPVDDVVGASLRLSAMNFGPLPDPDGVSRLQTLLGSGQQVDSLAAWTGLELDAGTAADAGLIAGCTGGKAAQIAPVTSEASVRAMAARHRHRSGDIPP